VDLLRFEAGEPAEVALAGDSLVARGADGLIGGVAPDSAALLDEIAKESGLPFLDLRAGGAPGPRPRCSANTFVTAPDRGALCRAVVRTLHTERDMRRWIMIGHVPDEDFRVGAACIEDAGGTLVATLAGIDPDGPGAIHDMGRRAEVDALLLLGSPASTWMDEYAAMGGTIPLVFTDPGAGAAWSARHPATTDGESDPASEAGSEGAGPHRDPRPSNVAEAFWPDLWRPELTRFGAGQLNARFFDRFGSEMDRAAWLGWIAVKVLWESGLRGNGTENGGLLRSLGAPGARFDGHKGRGLSFRPDGQLRQPLFVFGQRPDGGVDVVGASPDPGAEESFEEAFDRIHPRAASCETAPRTGDAS
jgi:hypothetical protein